MRIRLILAAILVLALAHRALIAWCMNGLPIDAAAVGNIAIHILEGERPLFMEGFHYSGVLLPYVTAVLFRVFGVSLAVLQVPPLLFAVGWIAATYLLFTELFNPRAGLAAAACLAVPDRMTAFYSAIPDCSYTPLLFLGTTALWLSARILLRPQTPARYTAHVLALALTAGLALWVQPLAVTYLTPAFVLLVVHCIRNRHRFHTWPPIPLGAFIVAVTGLLPYLLGPGGFTTGGGLRPSLVRYNATQLLTGLLPSFLYWPFTEPAYTAPLAVGLALAAGSLFIVRFAFARGRRDRLLLCVPFLVVAVYAVAYLPNEIAVLRAHRYVLPLWTMLLLAAVAGPLSSHRRWIRRPGLALLALWMLWNGLGLALTAGDERAATRANLERIDGVARHAATLGLRHVSFIDQDPVPSHAQAFYFASGGAVRFVDAEEERHQASADSADRDDDTAMLALPGQEMLLHGALEAVNAVYLSEDAAGHTFATGVRPRLRQQRAVPADAMRIVVETALPNAGPALHDRTLRTAVMGALGDRIHVDLGSTRRVSGFVLVPAYPNRSLLPAGYTLRGSLDGQTDFPIQAVDDAYPIHYSAGNGVYVQGSGGWMECAFAPVEARYLMLTVLTGYADIPAWHAAECYVLEHLGDAGPDPAGDLEQIASLLEHDPVDFLAADRWISARWTPSHGPGTAFARWNNHFYVANPKLPKLQRTFGPGHSRALAVPRYIADDTAAVIEARYGRWLTIQRHDLTYYTLLRFTGDPPPGTEPMHWTGLTVLN